MQIIIEDEVEGKSKGNINSLAESQESQEKKKSKRNPVAKNLHKFNKPKVFKDKSKYNRKKTIKEDESTQ